MNFKPLLLIDSYWYLLNVIIEGYPEPVKLEYGTV